MKRYNPLHFYRKQNKNHKIDPLDGKKSRKIISLILSGNFIEIFEFSLFGIFASSISNLFFNNVVYGTIYSLAILSIGFLARPIGAIILGHIGDRHGRRPALILSIAIMSLSTFCIGILPLPDQIGIGAPLLLLFLRILQGVSCGGEYIGVVVYLFEYFPKKPGKAGSIAAISGMGGTLAAIIISYLASLHVSSEWNWRIPFLFAPFFGFIIMYLRKNFDETSFFKNNILKNNIQKYPLKLVFKKYLYQFIATIFVGGFNGILTFTLIIYLNIFSLKYTNINFTSALGINFIAVCFFICSGLIFGFIKDSRNLSTASCLYFISGVTFISSPFIYMALLQGDYSYILLGEVILGVLAGSFSACCNVFMCQLFPSNIRYSGIALGYTLGTSLLGGTAPAFCHLLIELTKEPFMPAVYLSLGAIVGIVGCRIIYPLKKKFRNIVTKDYNLKLPECFIQEEQETRESLDEEHLRIHHGR